MIYLTTGANGAGKTLLMLKDVREQQLKENRPVYYNGFEALDAIKAFGWLPFEPKEWMKLPDGSICVMDECQNEFPLRKSGSEVPQYIADVAQFRRKRGFDFWMTAPHPMLIDVNIRRLIGAPSWHRHLKRVFGSDVASVSKWSAVKTDCEKPGAGDSGETTLRPFPKEVYSWYKSASLHTGKKRMPLAVYFVALAVVAVPVMGWIAFGKVTKPAIVTAQPAASAPQQVLPGARDSQAKPSALTTAQYVQARTPRIEGLQFTAPAYDGVTAPAVAPYPAACVSGFKPGSKTGECVCYTQQATRLVVPVEVCKQIATNGFFIEWHQEQKPSSPVTVAASSVGAVGPSQGSSGSVPLSATSTVDAQHDGRVIAAIRAKERLVR